MPTNRQANRRRLARTFLPALLPLALLAGLALLVVLLLASILGFGPMALGGCVAGADAGVDQPAIAATDPAALDAWIARRAPASPLVGQGAEFLAAGARYVLDPRLLVAIA